MEEVVSQTQRQSDNDDDEIKERREAEFERATMTRKQAEFTVKLQPLVDDDFGITFGDGDDGAVLVASVDELAFSGFAAEVGDRVLAVKGVHVATAAMATEVLSKHTSSSPPWISLNLTRLFNTQEATVINEDYGEEAAMQDVEGVGKPTAAPPAGDGVFGEGNGGSADTITSEPLSKEADSRADSTTAAAAAASTSTETEAEASSNRTVGRFRLDLLDVDKYKTSATIKEEIDINSKVVQGLGLSVKDNMGITMVPGFPITHVAPGGAAAQQGSSIEVGDLLLRVNNVSLVGRAFKSTVDTIRELTAVSKKNNTRMTIEFISVQKLFTVKIHRPDPKEPLGFKLRGNHEIGIVPQGLAFNSNLQHDQYILSVNGTPTTSMAAADIVSVMKEQGTDMVLETMPMAIFEAQITGKGTQPEEERWDGR